MYTWWYNCLECWLNTQWLVFNLFWWGIEFATLWLLFLVTLDTSYNKFGVMIPPYWLWCEYWIILKLIPFCTTCNSDWTNIDCTSIDWANIDWDINSYVLFMNELCYSYSYWAEIFCAIIDYATIDCGSYYYWDSNSYLLSFKFLSSWGLNHAWGIEMFC
jgi:hypothetical protein